MTTRRLAIATLAACTLLCAAPAARAQARSADAAEITPIEVLRCRFVAGKGPGDIEGLSAAFNRWMEQSRAPQYAAYVLLPQSHSTEIDFDLAWVGSWPDAETMGESMAHYFERAAELEGVFGGVMDCDSNTNYSVVTIREPAERGRFGPVEVGTCKLRLGASLDEALTAAREWVDYTGSIGSTAAHWLLFPAYGEHSEASYTFKWAVGYESYPAFGRDYDRATNGNGLDRYNELFADLLRCDSPRLYRTITVRAPHG
jgi:hypothetical protein